MRDINIDKTELGFRVKELIDDKARFITATCIDEGEFFEVIYHFEKDSELVNLRTRINKEEELTSISSIILGAALSENEMKDFFGIKIKDIAIDFKGRMLLSEESPVTPLLKLK
ncbi:MAG: NADH-quinone oxidoreductase subunit C [Peptococcaceae bacterium]|nr:NADH-quinone oxidoreductase subunit C [Peptococcaceae bacterium]